jgi:hypothetical protein
VDAISKGNNITVILRLAKGYLKDGSLILGMKTLIISIFHGTDDTLRSYSKYRIKRDTSVSKAKDL